ncbi:hypothetical protein CA830_17840 [Burkholderia multivorans]|nr:hypothetical protein CA830_17840 [Burkholderia multivorans]
MIGSLRAPEQSLDARALLMQLRASTRPMQAGSYRRVPRVSTATMRTRATRAGAVGKRQSPAACR